jgi:AcrR family transcriptional regulator
MPTQAERRATTRLALLDAAASTLVEHGAAGFTTAAVAGRAGLSNGALFRHFPTRLDLVGATVEHVLAGLREEYAAMFASGDSTRTSPEQLLELLWECMSHSELAGVYELYVQCRTDDALLAALQPIVSEHIDHIGELAAEVLPRIGHPSPAAAEHFVTLAVLSMQGLIINNLVGTSLGVERDLIVSLAAAFEATIVDQETP